MAKQKLIVEVMAEDGMAGAWIDVEAETTDEARELALKEWTGGPAKALRVWAEVEGARDDES